MKAAIVEQYGICMEQSAIIADWAVDEDNKITEVTFLVPEGTFTTDCSVCILKSPPQGV